MFQLHGNRDKIFLGVAILAVIITGVLLFANSSYGNSLSFLKLNFGPSKDAVAKSTIDYINKNLLEAGRVATAESVTEESGVYKIMVKVTSGGTSNVIASYVTKDGKLFFDRAIPVSTDANGNPAPAEPIKVSMDDDAVLGNKNAPITMVEFSDYECPFCKRHFQEVYPDIKKDYIDTGKVKMVFRDYVAVQAHNPLATSEALAASCARDQGGDSMYFKYHDVLYTNTTSNGNGLKLSQLPVFAKDLGLNVATFQQCLDSKKYITEFNKDNADAVAVLPGDKAGTPAFLIGKSSADGTISAQLIEGAQSYATFQAMFDSLLK